MIRYANKNNPKLINALKSKESGKNNRDSKLGDGIINVIIAAIEVIMAKKEIFLAYSYIL
jgi:hypothetical protein